MGEENWRVELESKNDKLESENAAFKSENAAFKSEIAAFKSENAGLKSEIAALLSQISGLQETVAETLESASAMSQAKKQKLIGWDEVLTPLGIQCPPFLEEFVPVEKFSKLTSDRKYELLAQYNLEENIDLILEKVAKVLGMSWLPSPSAMTVDDLPRILHGDLKKDNGVPTSINVSTSRPEVEEVRKKIEKLLKNKTEMEATIRVVTYVIDAAWEIPNIMVRLQPSLYKHSVFTDILLVLGETNDIKGFIEIKKTEISADLSEETKATAQAVREAHILILEKKMETVAFVLTNSKHWSFAKASKHGAQVQIDEIANCYIPRDSSVVLTMLKQIMQGTFL